MINVLNQSPVWHPYTQHALSPTMQRIIKADGAYLINENNEKILDAISSWWVITHAHCHPRIMHAIRQASENLDQVIFAEYTHIAAENLAYALLSIAPVGLSHVFYSDSGSTSVEVALKMALGYFLHSGMQRHRIVVMEHGYHGDTIGAMSVGERGVFNAGYESLLFSVEKIPFAKSGHEQETIDAFEAICESNEVAALIIEPLALGAGGFKFYSSEVLRELKYIAEKYGSLLIADEVMTGWGRTGTLFACEKANITPDILCTSKGLTGGALPLAATLCTSEIFLAHYSADRRKTFFHSSSYTANPIACAAACENIAIWKSEPVLARINQITAWHEQHLSPFKNDNRFMNVRQLGTIAALDLNVKQGGYFASCGSKLREYFREKQILLRPLGNTIYLLTPYCITASEIAKLYHAINEAADIVMKAK